MRKDCKRDYRVGVGSVGDSNTTGLRRPLEKKGDGQVPMRRTSKCSRKNLERGFISLPRPFSPQAITPPRNDIYLNTPPISLLVSPLHPISVFILFILNHVHGRQRHFSPCFRHAHGRQRQSWAFAIASPDDPVSHRIPHLPDRQRISSRHTCWPRRRHHRCCQWDRSCCHARVGQVKHLSLIRSFNQSKFFFLRHPFPSLLIRFSLDLAFVF